MPTFRVSRIVKDYWNVVAETEEDAIRFAQDHAADVRGRELTEIERHTGLHQEHWDAWSVVPRRHLNYDGSREGKQE